MKRVFVAIPPKYGVDNDGVRAYEREIEEAAHKAEKILDQYLEVCTPNYSYLTEKNANDKCVKGFVYNSLHNLCNADLAIFAGDWEHSKEGRLLHTIAVGFDIPILNLDTEELTAI